MLTPENGRMTCPERGGDVNAQDKDQTNSLMAAAARGHTDIVEALLEAGASVNELNV